MNAYNQNGKKEGLWEHYYHSRCDMPYSKGYFLDGIEEGHWEWYYDTGTISFRGCFKKGMADGYWIWYYPNGEISDEHFYFR